MEHRLDSTIRNCGARHPKSVFATKGWEIGPVKIYECPKTFIKKRQQSMIEAYDCIKSMGLPIGRNLSDISAEFVEVGKIIESERSYIIQEVRNARQMMKKNNVAN